MGGLKRLRLHSADSTLPHLWPTGSRVRVAPVHYGLVLLLKPFRLCLAADALPSGKKNLSAPEALQVWI